MSELSRSKSCGESFHGTQQALGLMQYMNRCTLSSHQGSQILQQCSEMQRNKVLTENQINHSHRYTAQMVQINLWELINGKAFE